MLLLSAAAAAAAADSDASGEHLDKDRLLWADFPLELEAGPLRCLLVVSAVPPLHHRCKVPGELCTMKDTLHLCPRSGWMAAVGAGGGKEVCLDYTCDLEAAERSVLTGER